MCKISNFVPFREMPRTSWRFLVISSMPYDFIISKQVLIFSYHIDTFPTDVAKNQWVIMQLFNIFHQIQTKRAKAQIINDKDIRVLFWDSYYAHIEFIYCLYCALGLSRQILDLCKMHFLTNRYDFICISNGSYQYAN